MADVAIEEAVDATVVEEPAGGPSTDVVRHDRALSVAPQVGAQELVTRLEVIRDAMQTAMTPDVDYGVIPGTGGKPTLLKPGAEKLSALFQLDVQLLNEKLWDGSHLTVISHATVFHAPSGARLGYGEGVCSTRERKYAYRNEQRTCPQCSKPAIIKGKAEYGGGWVCFKKKDGCGAKFDAGDQQIEGQVVGQVENPDLPDAWNTVVKMAEKRARVDAVLAVTGASALFTQDVEDAPQGPPEGPQDAPAPQGDPEHPHGPMVDASQRTRVSTAAKKLCGGSAEGGKALYVKLVTACGGYMPYAAGLALVEAAAVIDGVPWDPAYQPPRNGDIPSAEQAQAEQARQAAEPTEEEIARKGVEVFEAWLGAGLSEPQAQKRAEECRGRWNALVISLEAAQRTIRQREAVQR